MKYILMSMMLSLGVISSVHAASPATASTYSIDPAHTFVLWHINHFGYSHPSGKWMVAQGQLTLDEAKPQNSKVSIVINTADVVTGIPKLDEHLRSKDFFDVSQYPQATFVSEKVKVIDKDKALVQGKLTVRGISKPLTLAIKMNHLGVNPITHLPTVGFTGSTKLNRSDFGISNYLPGLGDEVNIEIEAEANKADDIRAQPNKD